MIGFTPRRPSGSDAHSRFLQWVFDSIVSLRPQQTPNARTNSTTRGFYSVPLVGSSEAPPQEPTPPPKRGTVTAIFADYYTVRLAQTQQLVKVAKNFKLRNIIGQEIIVMGNITLTFQYTYIDFMKRQAKTTLPDSTVYSETQVVVPRMIIGDTIRVFQPSDGTGLLDLSITYEDFNTDGRVWTKEYQN